MFSFAIRVDDDRIERARPQKEALYCPRCNSSNTNFCYCFNISHQLRYFCETYRSYWTEDVSHGNKMATIFDFIIMDKMPTAAGSVKCGDADECSLLTKQTSPQEQFILNSSGDGGSDNPHSNRALKITTFAQTPFIGIYPQHLRKIYLASEVDSLEAILMMHDSQGINADGPMPCVFILDSASPEHCTGDISQLSDYHPEVRPDRYLRGAGGTLMRVHGTGSIRNENFQVKGVLYVPGLNNQPNINKTIFSVAKLNELGYNVLFNSDGSSSVIDNSKGTWNLKHEIIGKAQKKYGHFMLDYLRIPLNRDPMPMLEGPGLLKSLWNASRSVWSSITGHLSQRTTCAQRPPV